MTTRVLLIALVLGALGRSCIASMSNPEVMRSLESSKLCPEVNNIYQCYFDNIAMLPGLALSGREIVVPTLEIVPLPCVNSSSVVFD